MGVLLPAAQTGAAKRTSNAPNQYFKYSSLFLDTSEPTSGIEPLT